MSTPCSIAGGRSIGSSAALLLGWAIGDCQAWPEGTAIGGGCAIHGSSTVLCGEAAAGGAGGTALGAGIGAGPCQYWAETAAGSESALSARRRWNFMPAQ